jgi:hypothetical protein
MPGMETKERNDGMAGTQRSQGKELKKGRLG